MKNTFHNVATLVVSTVVMLLLLEGVFRVYYSLRPDLLSLPDPTLGWIVKPDVQLEMHLTDWCGRSYEAAYATDARGFRYAGDTAADYRVLFLGDSFTQAAEVSTDSAYYTEVERRLADSPVSVGVFAYGAGGYGTLQEAMMLERIIGRVRPHLVVLQFTSNDFINNCEVLERRSIQNCNTIRPYLTLDNRIVHRFPKNYPRIRAFANNYSRLLFFIVNRLDAFRSKDDRFTRADYEASVVKTGHALRRLWQLCRSRGAAMASFIVERGNGIEYQLYRELMDRHRIPVLADVPEAIARAEQAGACCRAGDGGHWNSSGHRVAGRAVAAGLRPYLDAAPATVQALQ